MCYPVAVQNKEPLFCPDKFKPGHKKALNSSKALFLATNARTVLLFFIRPIHMHRQLLEYLVKISRRLTFRAVNPQPPSLGTVYIISLVSYLPLNTSRAVTNCDL